MKILRLTITVLILMILIGSLTVYAQQQPNSCSTPGAGFLRQLLGHISTRWNCWLQDSVYSYYVGRGFDQSVAVDYGAWAVNQDAADRFDAALTQLRNANPQWFDQVMTVHGLSFMPAQ